MTDVLKRLRWPIVGVGIAVVVLAFLAFRPDTLFVDDTVDESLADAFTTVTSVPSRTDSSPTTTSTSQPGEAEVPATAASTTTTTADPPGPAGVATGSFYGIDHSAEGTATVYEQDGRYVLRLEDDTDIQNGPDLYVWLVPTEDYEGGAPSDYLDLGKIKGNVGGQNYELPRGFDPAVHWTVLVWCVRFSVPFAAAPLA